MVLLRHFLCVSTLLHLLYKFLSLCLTHWLLFPLILILLLNTLKIDAINTCIQHNILRHKLKAFWCSTYTFHSWHNYFSKSIPLWLISFCLCSFSAWVINITNIAIFVHRFFACDCNFWRIIIMLLCCCFIRISFLTSMPKIHYLSRVWDTICSRFSWCTWDTLSIQWIIL